MKVMRWQGVRKYIKPNLHKFDSCEGGWRGGGVMGRGLFRMS